MKTCCVAFIGDQLNFNDLLSLHLNLNLHLELVFVYIQMKFFVKKYNFLCDAILDNWYPQKTMFYLKNSISSIILWQLPFIGYNNNKTGIDQFQNCWKTWALLHYKYKL